MATALDVPHTDEAPLRLRVARALLLAGAQQFKRAVAPHASVIADPQGVAEMALMGMIAADPVAVVRACFDQGTPKGLLTHATGKDTVRLLVTRALGVEVSGKHYDVVEDPTRTPKTWATKVREVLAGLMGFDPGQLTDAELGERLAEWGGAMLSFRFDGNNTPLADIECISQARALVMLNSAQPAPPMPADYAEIRVFACDDPACRTETGEKAFLDALSLLQRFFPRKKPKD